MADVRQPVMEQVAQEVGLGLGTATSTDNFIRRSMALSLRVEKRKLSIERAVEFEIVPRLVFAHRTQTKISDASSAPATPSFCPDDVRAFCELVLGQNADAAGAHVQSLVEQGVALESIYLNLISPAARFFKYQWLEDERDFADVTLALWRLQQILREYSAAFRSDRQKAVGLRALLTPGPSEPHDLGYLMFGLVLLGEFFRRDGWDTWIEPKPQSQELCSAIQSEWFDVVEFLVSGEKRLDELAASIKAIRKASLNRSLGVIVCGPMFVEHPELALLVGGDVAAADPRDGVSRAQNLVGTLTKRE
jgi:MerR family transcriptional regulator, light-induced transcriptional regulator